MIDARVTEIYTAPRAGKPMKPVNQAYAMGGLGLDGDRYAEGLGAYSKKSRVIRHVTFISLEGIGIANTELEKKYLPADTRRNIITENIHIESLVDKEFSIGRAVMRGVEVCVPCKRPEHLSEKPGFEDAFKLLGGLRAEVMESGLIKVGAQIHYPPKP